MHPRLGKNTRASHVVKMAGAVEAICGRRGEKEKKESEIEREKERQKKKSDRSKSKQEEKRK